MINLTISADSAEELLHQLSLISLRLMLGVDQTEPSTAATPEEQEIAAELVKNAAPPPDKPNGADVVETPKSGRGRGKKAAPTVDLDIPATAEARAVAFDRQAIIKGLTDIYMTSAPGVRDKITAFRDAQGVQRLRELKDEAIPAAARLLSELAAEDAAAP
jgi:hypothetical protein